MSPANRQRLSKSTRIRTAQEFAQLRRLGKKAQGKLLTVLSYRRKDEGKPRLAVVVSGKVAGSVERNLWRRRLREIFRRELLGKQVATNLPMDLLVQPTARCKTVAPAYGLLKDEFITLIEKLV